MNLATVGFHFIEELLAVGLRQLIQLDMTERRNGMDINPFLVALLRSRTDAGFAVIFVPVVDPVTEAHIGLDFEGRNLAVLGLDFLKLFDALGLGLGQYAFCLGFAVFIVAYDMSAFPASVLSFTDSALTVFAFLSHVFTPLTMKSSMKPPTISDAFRCISPVTWV